MISIYFPFKSISCVVLPNAQPSDQIAIRISEILWPYLYSTYVCFMTNESVCDSGLQIVSGILHILG